MIPQHTPIIAAFEAIKNKRDKREERDSPEFKISLDVSQFLPIEIERGYNHSRYTATLVNHPHVKEVEYLTANDPEQGDIERFNIEMHRPRDQKTALTLPAIATALRTKGYRVGRLFGNDSRIKKLLRSKPVKEIATRSGQSVILVESAGKGRSIGIYKGKNLVGKMEFQLRGKPSVHKIELHSEEHIGPVINGIFERRMR